MKIPRKFRVFQHFLSLILVGLAAFAAGGLVWCYYQFNPSYSAVGWSGFDDAIAIMMAFCFVLFVGVIWWTHRIITDIIQHKSFRKFVLWNVVLLLIPYGPVIGYLGYIASSHIHWSWQRYSITRSIDQYENILPPFGWKFRNIEVRSDSIFIFTTNPQDKNATNSSKPFRFADSRFDFSHGTMQQMVVYQMKNGELELAVDFNPDIDTSGFINVIHTPSADRCLWHRSNDDHHYIEWYNQCTNEYRHVLHGYQESDRSGGGSKLLYYYDQDGSEWSIFYTEKKTYDPTRIYVAHIGEGIQEVFDVKLTNEDRAAFDPEKIVGIYKEGVRFGIVSHGKIICIEIG